MTPYNIPVELLNHITVGDAAQLLRLLPDECIDLTVTSPPYDNLRSYNGYVFEFESIATQLYRVTKTGGVVVWVVCDSSIGGGESLTSFKQALFFAGIGFFLNDTMIYEKPNRRQRQYRANRYEQTFEYMFVFTKGNKSNTFNPIDEPCLNKGRRIKFTSRDARKANNFTAGGIITTNKNTVVKETKRIGNIWKYTNNTSKIKHPAVFPEDLAKDHILSWSNAGDIVLDPMCGSGTTCKEAKKLARNWIGFEISEEYAKDAIERVYNARTPLFVL